MNWIRWSLLSAFFASVTTVLAKAGVTGVDSDLATPAEMVIRLSRGIPPRLTGFSCSAC